MAEFFFFGGGGVHFHLKEEQWNWCLFFFACIYYRNSIQEGYGYSMTFL